MQVGTGPGSGKVVVAGEQTGLIVADTGCKAVPQGCRIRYGDVDQRRHGKDTQLSATSKHGHLG
jgi:hypothetical protein